MASKADTPPHASPTLGATNLAQRNLAQVNPA